MATLTSNASCKQDTERSNPHGIIFNFSKRGAFRYLEHLNRANSALSFPPGVVSAVRKPTATVDAEKLTRRKAILQRYLCEIEEGCCESMCAACTKSRMRLTEATPNEEEANLWSMTRATRPVNVSLRHTKVGRWLEYGIRQMCWANVEPEDVSSIPRMVLRILEVSASEYQSYSSSI